MDSTSSVTDVLSQARRIAAMKVPSRPFTPASKDSRRMFVSSSSSSSFSAWKSADATRGCSSEGRRSERPNTARIVAKVAGPKVGFVESKKRTRSRASNATSIAATSSNRSMSKRWRRLKTKLRKLCAKVHARFDRDVNDSDDKVVSDLWAASKEFCAAQSSSFRDDDERDRPNNADNDNETPPSLVDVEGLRCDVIRCISSKVVDIVGSCSSSSKSRSNRSNCKADVSRRRRNVALLLSKSCIRIARSALWVENVDPRDPRNVSSTTTVSGSSCLETIGSLGKTLYKISKAKEIDRDFQESGLLQEILELISTQSSTTQTATREALLSVSRRTVGEVAFVTWPCPFETMIYCAAVVKNVTQSASVQSWMGKHGGGVGILTDLLRVLVSAPGKSDRASSKEEDKDEVEPRDTPRRPRATGWTRIVTVKQAAQVLVQVTASLRNLTLTRKHFKQFVSHGSIDAICAIARDRTFQEHADLMYNISRILSKLSLDQQCRREMKSRGESNIEAMLRMLDLHSHHRGLVIRVCFALGNMTASNGTNRRIFMTHNVKRYVSSSSKESKRKYDDDEENDSSDDDDNDGACTIGNVFKRYVQEYVTLLSMSSATDLSGGKDIFDRDEAIEEVDEVLVKLVRLVANVAIDPGAGPHLAASSISSTLVELLSFIALQPVNCDDRTYDDEGKTVKASPSSLSSSSDRRRLGEELRVFVVSVVTNLSYYGACAKSRIFKSRLDITKYLVPLLVTSTDAELVSEALRALGNFTRDPDVRDLVAEMHGNEATIVLLDHRDPDVVLTACGVILNFAADPVTTRTIAFQEFDAVGKLFEILSEGIMTDADVAIVACKALCNFAINRSRRGNLAVEEEANGDVRVFFSAEQCCGLNALLSDLAVYVSEEGDSAGLSAPDLARLEPIAKNLLRNVTADCEYDEDDERGREEEGEGGVHE